MRDLKVWRWVVCVHQQIAELGLVDCVKGLVGCNNPLRQQVLELFLVPWTL